MRISGAAPLTSAPSPRSTSDMIGTSMMSGTLPSVVVPSASRAAAITLSTLFLAPVTATSPASRAPPTTRKLSIGGMVAAATVRARKAASAGGTRLRPMADDAREKDHSTIHLTRIYTRTGDDGTTALGDMSRVRKTDPRITAYADVDEANAAIGTALALGALPAEVAEVLAQVQNDMFDVGADLCTPI